MEDIFTLDFCKNTVIFQGKELPTGALACEALNIPEEVIAAFAEPMENFSFILMKIAMGGLRQKTHRQYPTNGLRVVGKALRNAAFSQAGH